MSGAQTATPAAATETTEGPSFLDQVVAATRQTTPDHAQELVKTLVEQALSGTVTFDKNLTRTIDSAVAAIDRKLSDQLNAIMHHPKFSALEGTWRGLHYLVMNSETGTALKLQVLNLPKRELSRDLQRAVEFDQSQLFKKIYENEFGTPGGEPYGALIGDYEWTQHPDDIETLRLVSNVAAAAFAPFISAAGAGMFGFDKWPDLAKPRDLAKIFETQDYTKWRSFRDSEDARFVNLVLPRTLARLPYGAATKAIDEFAFEEAPYDEAGAAKPMQHNEYCWMNAAYTLGTKLTDAFAKFGFCTAIRGAEGGGKVENLPYHVFTSDDGDLDAKCPTEIAITDRREIRKFELAAVGDGDLGAAALHHGDQPFCALPEGDGARQDRQLHGSERCRAVAEPVDQQLCQRQRECRAGDESALPVARGTHRRTRDTGQARLLQRDRVPAAVASDGRADHQPAHGGPHPGSRELTAALRFGQPDR